MKYFFWPIFLYIVCILLGFILTYFEKFSDLNPFQLSFWIGAPFASIIVAFSASRTLIHSLNENVRRSEYKTIRTKIHTFDSALVEAKSIEEINIYKNMFDDAVVKKEWKSDDYKSLVADVIYTDGIKLPGIDREYRDRSTFLRNLQVKNSAKDEQ